MLYEQLYLYLSSFPYIFFLSYLIIHTSVRDINNWKLKKYYLKLLMYLFIFVIVLICLTFTCVL